MEQIRQTPSSIYIDTSVVAAAIAYGSLHHTSAVSFFDGLIQHGTRVCVSQLLRLELLQAVRNLGTVPASLPETVRRHHNLGRWGNDVDVRLRWLNLGAEQYDSLVDDLIHVYEIPFRTEDWRNSIALMCQYHLKSYDAYHAATALALGVLDFATIDAHFTRVSELTVHLIRDPEPAPPSS